MKKILFGMLGIIVVIQFIRPNFTNPKVDEQIALKADEQVMNVLKKACYDCHSDETRYPLYSTISPISWLIVGHVSEGREALNFSQWSNIDATTRITRIERAKQLVHNGMMPIASYTLIHKKAKLEQEEKEILEKFFKLQLQKLKNS